MTRKSIRILVASLVLATAGTAGAAAPAAAGGTMSFTFQPTNSRDAELFQAGMQIYSMIQGAQNGSIRQNGRDNRAGVGQNGRDNRGFIQQNGNGHEATLQQNGNGNSHGIFQFGQGARANVVQNGGQTGATVQFGW